jgi:hypothetical protein
MSEHVTLILGLTHGCRMSVMGDELIGELDAGAILRSWLPQP